MDSSSPSSPSPAAAPSSSRVGENPLSYKFQRLRERLRTAVASGELSGKLPGERALARRFQVNAKTLSKALTDLAAEGLLDRSIGRGTYVRSATDRATAGDERAGRAKPARWLIVCEADRAATCPVVRSLRAINPQTTLIHDVSATRPSFLKQFDAAIDLSLRTPERFLRDLLVRNFPVVTVNREPDVLSVNSVCADRSLGASAIARDLILGGHGRMVVVESLPRSVVGRAVKLTANRYGPHAVVDVCASVGELPGAIKGGATAVVCDSIECAREARAAIEAAGLRVPQDACLTAVDCCEGDAPCSGHYVEGAVLAQAVAELLRGGGGQRPANLWLAPRWVDRGTTRSIPHPQQQQPRAAKDEAA